MAELFEVPVSELLGKSTAEQLEPNEANTIVQQLTILNEQLARQNKTRRRTLWTVLISILVILLIGSALYILLFISFSFSTSTHSTHETGHADFNCTLDSTSYNYTVSYDDQFNILTAQIDDYFKVRGETCIITQHTEKHSIHHDE